MFAKYEGKSHVLSVPLHPSQRAAHVGQPPDGQSEIVSSKASQMAKAPQLTEPAKKLRFSMFQRQTSQIDPMLCMLCSHQAFSCFGHVRPMKHTMLGHQKTLDMNGWFHKRGHQIPSLH